MKTAATPRVLTIHLPSFGLQARARRDGSLRAQPLALVPAASEGSGARVLEVSRAARDNGVEPGLTVARARAACPDLVVFSVSDGDLEQARREVVDALVPIVARVEWGGGGVFHADARGVVRLHGSEATLLVRCAQALQSLGYLARIACASTRLASLMAARTRQGLAIIREGGERELLDPLALSLLPLSHETIARLDLLGVRSLGDLARLPEDGLADRFGRDVARWQRQVRGEEAPPLVSMADPRAPQALIELDEPVGGLEPALFLLKSCCERLAEELEQAGLAASRLELRFLHETGASDARILEPARPLAGARELLTLCRGELEARPVRDALTGLSLAAVTTSPRGAFSGEFFGRSLDLAALGGALDRVRALLGADRVVRPAPRSAHRREARVAWEPFGIRDVRDARSSPAREDDADRERIPPRVLRLLPRPLPALVRLPLAGLPADGPGALDCGVAPRLGFGLPDHAEIRSASGPVRVAGEWWDRGADVDRDEYVLHASEGGAYLVARDRRTRRWQLMGWFD